jgi:hypothetical protein
MRDFSKNVSNFMDLGTGVTAPELSGAAAISFSLWAVVDTVDTTGTTANRMFTFEVGGGDAGLGAMLDDEGSGTVMRLRSRSVAAESERILTGTTTFSNSVLHHLVGAWDFPNDTAYIWVDGVQQSGGQAFLNSTYTTSTCTETDRIGASTATITTTGQFDGGLGELVLWKRLLTQNEVTSLSLGMSPWQIDKPALYWPLHGFESPEADLAAGLLGTITGSLPKRTEMPPVLPIESLVAQGGFPFASSVFNVAPLASNLMRRKAA